MGLPINWEIKMIKYNKIHSQNLLLFVLFCEANTHIVNMVLLVYIIFQIHGHQCSL